MTEATQQDQVKLTSRQLRFVEYYLQCWVATVAAEKAGYRVPKERGWRLLRIPYIQDAIAERMKTVAMDTDEILFRLSQQGRASVADFFDFVEVTNTTTGEVETKAVPNWNRVKEFGYLIKKIELTRDGSWKIELNDPQNALVQLGRARKLFVDRTELDLEKSLKAYIGISPDDWDDDQE